MRPGPTPHGVVGSSAEALSFALRSAYSPHRSAVGAAVAFGAVLGDGQGGDVCAVLELTFFDVAAPTSITSTPTPTSTTNMSTTQTHDAFVAGAPSARSVRVEIGLQSDRISLLQLVFVPRFTKGMPNVKSALVVTVAYTSKWPSRAARGRARRNGGTPL